MNDNLVQLSEEASTILDNLKEEVITIEQDGIVIAIKGNQEVIQIILDGKNENRLVKAFNEAINKTQELAGNTLIAYNK